MTYFQPDDDIKNILRCDFDLNTDYQLLGPRSLKTLGLRPKFGWISIYRDSKNALSLMWTNRRGQHQFASHDTPSDPFTFEFDSEFNVVSAHIHTLSRAAEVSPSEFAELAKILRIATLRIGLD